MYFAIYVTLITLIGLLINFSCQAPDVNNIDIFYTLALTTFSTHLNLLFLDSIFAKIIMICKNTLAGKTFFENISKLNTLPTNSTYHRRIFDVEERVKPNIT
jgi:hypothetical protein